ncbi:MAG: gamma-glutamyl-gamma-aminobutyrate hydrolase family protein [Candidatus Binatia bacterium]
MAAVVGLTSYTPSEENQNCYSLPREYIDALREQSCSPMLLTDGEPEPLLTALDGLVLSGGGDIAALSYGASDHPESYLTDLSRDRFEIRLLRRAMEIGMPVLAICRGMQVLNVSLGGTLVGHLPDRYGQGLAHRAPPREPLKHNVTVEDGCLLTSVVGRSELEVVSWHHQAVDRLGEGLRPAAVAADGVIEALELDSYPWILAIQWHPELNAGQERRQAAIFAAFCRAAEGFKRTSRERGHYDPRE